MVNALKLSNNVIILFAFLLFNLCSSAQLAQLKVSAEKRHLVTADGKPFFWLGDTGWELFHKLHKGDADAY